MSIVARGCYRYWRDGQAQAIEEPFTLTDSGSALVLAGQRIVNGQALLTVTADYEAGECVSMSLNWTGPGSAAGGNWRYRRDGSRLLWHGPDQPSQSLDLPEGCRLFPLLRAATGPILTALCRAPATLVLPCLRDPADTAAFLRPLLSERRAQEVGSGGNGDRHIRYFGGEYGATGADYWLGAHGLVQRYRWESAQGCWEARLEELSCAPDFAAFAAAG